MSEGTRRRASTAMAVLGAVLAIAGAMALYLRQEIFRSDPFADRAVETLDHEQVRAALARPIVEKALDSGPDELINATPVLEAAVDGALDSAPFRKLFRGAARKTHQALFEGEGDQLALTISDLNLIIAQAVTAISPRLGKQVPDKIGKKLVEITDSDPALRAARAAERVRFLGVMLPILGLLLLAGSIALAPDRRRALLWCSSSLAAGAALALVVMLVARSAVLGQFGDETVRDAADAAWQVFFGTLRTWILVIGGVSILIAAAAAMGREVDATVPARAVVRRATSTPSGTAGRLARALLVGAGGLVLLLQPQLALELVAVVLGAYGLFFAACELMAMLAPPPRRGKAKGPSRGLRFAIGGAALAAAVALAVVLIGGGGEKGPVKRPAGPAEACNGYAALCDLPLNQVALPAAHNAMSAAELPGWYQPNQRYGIQRQLEDGIRVFLIDSHPGIKRGSGPVFTDFEREDEGKVRETLKQELGAGAAERFGAISERFATRGGQGTPGDYLCHVVCELGSIKLTKALGWYRDFLDTHPDEFVTLFIEDYITPKDTADAFKQSGILRYAYVHDRDEPFPTLRKLIQSDKRLFVMAEKDNGGGEYPWYHDGFELTQETPYDFHTPAELAAPKSCRLNRGEPDSPLFQVNHWIEKIPRSPSTAREVNSFDFMSRRVKLCEARRELLSNWIAVDFYNEGDLFGVIRALNGLPRGAQPTYRTTG